MSVSLEKGIYEMLKSGWTPNQAKVASFAVTPEHVEFKHSTTVRIRNTDKMKNGYEWFKIHKSEFFTGKYGILFLQALGFDPAPMGGNLIFRSLIEQETYIDDIVNHSTKINKEALKLGFNDFAKVEKYLVDRGFIITGLQKDYVDFTSAEGGRGYVDLQTKNLFWTPENQGKMELLESVPRLINESV